MVSLNDGVPEKPETQSQTVVSSKHRPPHIPITPSSNASNCKTLSRMVIPNTHLTYRMSHLTFITKTCTKYTGTSTNHSYQLSRKHVPSTHLTFHRPLFIFTTKTCTEYTSVTFNLYHENMYQVHRTIYESAIIYHENMYQVHRTIYKS